MFAGVHGPVTGVVEVATVASGPDAAQNAALGHETALTFGPNDEAPFVQSCTGPKLSVAWAADAAGAQQLNATRHATTIRLITLGA